MSTDVNTSQHMSTHPKAGGDTPHIWDLHICLEGGKAGLQGWDALQDGGKPLKDGFSPYNWPSRL